MDFFKAIVKNFLITYVQLKILPNDNIKSIQLANHLEHNFSEEKMYGQVMINITPKACSDTHHKRNTDKPSPGSPMPVNKKQLLAPERQIEGNTPFEKSRPQLSSNLKLDVRKRIPRIEARTLGRRSDSANRRIGQLPHSPCFLSKISSYIKVIKLYKGLEQVQSRINCLMFNSKFLKTRYWF